MAKNYKTAQKVTKEETNLLTGEVTEKEVTELVPIEIPMIEKPVNISQYGTYEVNANGLKFSKMHPFQPIPQIGEYVPFEKNGEPTVIPITKPSELKRRFREALTGEDGLFGIDEVGPVELNQGFTDVEMFNEMMSQSPYACTHSGLSRYEIAMLEGEAKTKQNLEDARHWLAMKETKLGQTLASLQGEERETLMRKLEEIISNPPPNNPEQSGAKQ